MDSEINYPFRCGEYSLSHRDYFAIIWRQRVIWITKIQFKTMHSAQWQGWYCIQMLHFIKWYVHFVQKSIRIAAKIMLLPERWQMCQSWFGVGQTTLCPIFCTSARTPRCLINNPLFDKVQRVHLCSVMSHYQRDFPWNAMWTLSICSTDSAAIIYCLFQFISKLHWFRRENMNADGNRYYRRCELLINTHNGVTNSLCSNKTFPNILDSF